MLVLSRKRNARTFLTLPDGQIVTIVVVEIHGDKVRLGFDGPPTVKIARDDCKRGERNVPNAA